MVHKKTILFSSILVLLLGVILGFIMQDPFGSKTPANTDQKPYVSNGSGIQTDGTPIYTDNFDGNNDTTALRSRGYLIYQMSNPRGTTFWFQGNSAVFPAYNGPTTGYVGANFNAAAGSGNIDVWMVTPKITGGLIAGDSLYFWSRSPDASTYPDSIRVMYSVNDSTPSGTWTELGRFKVSTSGWLRKGFRAPVAGINARFAIRYNVVNGGPSGSNSDYIGIDALNIIRTSGPSSTIFASVWCPLNTYPVLPSATYFQAAAWLGDTLYVQTPSTTGAAQTTILRYTLGGGWTTGVPCLVGVTGATLTAANGKLYLIGGGTSSVTTGSNNVQEYNPATGTWTAKAPLPAALSAHGTVNWGDSVLFVVGGPYIGSGTNQAVHYYRIGSDTWGTLATSLPAGQGRRSHATGIVGNKIYIAAGYNTVFLKNMYIGTIGSDATQLTWAAGPDIPTPWTGISRTGGAGYAPFFYVVGGERGGVGGYSDSTFLFNTVSNTWQLAIDNKPVAMSNMWAGVTLKKVNDTVKVFVPGGYSGTASASFDVIGCGGTITEVKNVSTVPADYSLSQNYPNPFNPTTKINFSIPKNGIVTLKVYDILGKEVATLVNGEKTAGSYIVDFNASNLASGVYFYRIEVNGFSEVKRMMLVK